MSQYHCKAIKVLDARIGLVSNNPELMDKSQFYLLDTNFRKVEEIEFSDNLDSYIYINEQMNVPPRIQIDEDRLTITGDITQLSAEAEDKRYGLFSNLGLLSRYIIHLLEMKHDIYSFHAAGFYEQNTDRFIIIIGGAGSGKTCFLLSAIEEGISIFGTEFTHFRIKSNGSVVLLKGALRDNIRVGNLKYDYPEAKVKLGINIPKTEDEWSAQLWDVDLSKFQTKNDKFEDPELIIVFPHIERNWKGMIRKEVTSTRNLRKLLFDNITEKVGIPFLLWEKVTIDGLDSRLSLEKRLRTVEQLIQNANIKKAVKVIVGTNTNIREVIK